MSENQGNWYLKQKHQITGPFSTAVIINHLAVGRLTVNDQVSTDAQQWLPISNITELTQDLNLKDLDLAKRQLDERTGKDRRELQEFNEDNINQRRGERRQSETAETISHRALRNAILDKYAQQRRLILWPIVIVFICFFALTVTAVLYPTIIPIAEPNCSAEAAPHVNWSNCIKPKLQLNNVDLTAASMRNSVLTESQMLNVTLTSADLAYANLQFSNLSYAKLDKAVLLGADLRHADLGNANLTDADLSFVNLQAANVSEVNFSGAKLGNAIWTDGKVCAKASIGVCLTQNE